MHAHLFIRDRTAFTAVPRRQRATGSVSSVTCHNGSASASRDQVATLMLKLETSLPSMSCSQLASTITSVQYTYKAAVLGVEAGQSNLDEVVEYYSSELPDRSWLLTFRASVADQLSAAVPQQAGNLSSSSTMGCCNAQHLLAIITALAGLPIQVVQPLPSRYPAILSHLALLALFSAMESQLQFSYLLS